jgi:ribulose-5-phosphate 4-epimerase/fuculose-1-phosphate aldolase
MNEGVIKFQCDHTFCCDEFDITNIDKCRQQLLNAGLVGRDPNRYSGYSFGNVSERRGNEILITATQTSHIKVLDYLGYVFIEQSDLANNTVNSRGAAKPSSESLTHVQVYMMDQRIGGVAHVHSPKIWARSDLLRTDSNVPYGSPEMALEVKRLFEETDVKERRIFAMGGHEDGIIAFGPDIQYAVDLLLNTIVT